MRTHNESNALDGWTADKVLRNKNHWLNRLLKIFRR
jgi:hypothetical protein